MNLFFWLAIAIPFLFAVLFGIKLFESIDLIRKAIAQLARKDFRTIIVSPPLSGFSAMAEDLRTISELLQNQTQMLSEEGFSLKTILSSMAEGVMIVDTSLRIRLANNALAIMFSLGRSPVGRNLAEVFMHSELLRACGETLSFHAPRSVEFSIVFGLGSQKTEKHFEAYASPVSQEGKNTPASVVIVIRDVTKLKKLEMVRKEFVANVSHEFRTPLSIINGYIEILMDEEEADSQNRAKFLQIMQKHCSRLDLLIGDLLVISQLEHQNLPLSFSRISLSELISRTLEHIDASIKETGAKISVSINPPDLSISADSARMDQVFFNLLANALRYGGYPNLAPTITITGEATERGIEIRFCDQGLGIPYQDQPFVFDRFYRVGKDRSRDAGGTGLGLSIVKNIIIAHGGSIELQSTPGAGCCFIIRLPHSR